jgi:hypothetical protein
MLGSARSAFIKKAAIVPPSFPAPVAAYNFNAGSGATIADNSGNGNTLTITGASWEPSGHTGAALTNSTNTVGASTSSFSNTNHLTLMAWVKPLDLTAERTQFVTGFMQSGGGTDAALFTQRTFNTHNVLQADLRISGGVVAITGSALTTGTWSHIAVTYDGTTIVLYADGTEVANFPITGTVDVNSSPFYVAGTNASAGFDAPDLTVDDVRAFNVALTQAEVAAAMSTPA